MNNLTIKKRALGKIQIYLKPKDKIKESNILLLPDFRTEPF